MANLDDLDPRTPVLIGVGQVSDPIDTVDYHGWSPVDLGAEAARLALADAGIEGSVIDTIAAVRQFEVSSPIGMSPFGRSLNVPRSIGNRIGADPKRAILEAVGGQSPQHLVGELGDDIAGGRSDVTLIVGAEALSTVRHLAGEDKPDWNENPAGDLEDRGFQISGIANLNQVRHGLVEMPHQYALLEHARRARLGLSREGYAQTMGALFAPLSAFAATNPYAAMQEPKSADELIAVDDNNRMVADPYPKNLVARDLVNQGAALLVASVESARRLGVAEDKWVFLHGHADLHELGLIDRPELGKAPAAVASIELALERAGITLADVDAMDLYSCFPIAVSVVCDGLGIAPDDPRGLTLTGGLPYFGGPGNNYSTHAIAEAVGRARQGQTVLVGANGGLMSKYSAGVYSAAPATWPRIDSSDRQRELDAVEGPPVAQGAFEGWATIETYTVAKGRRANVAIVVGRLESDGSRFLANPFDGDEEFLDLLTDTDPIGARIWVRAFGYGNRVTLTKERSEQLSPRVELGLREDYQHIEVRRDGRVLEVTINRPEVRNALHVDAHLELEQVFDTFEADKELWVAIITGAGDKAFCSGNDLGATASGGYPWFPFSGFGGLTSRRLTKPVIAAVNGIAYGGGFEIALSCSVVVADEAHARFALPEVKVGLFAAAGGVVRLPRRIPPAVANDLILTGRSIDAAEAARLGLVSRVGPDAVSLAREVAQEIVAVSPTSVRLSLQAIEDSRHVADEIDAVRYPTDAMDQLLISEDAMEGIMAFAEKRTPNWKNR